MGYYKNAAMSGYRVRNSLIELDATGSLGMLKRLRYDEIIGEETDTERSA